MKLKHLLEKLQELPEDYEICLSGYFMVNESDIEDLPQTDEEADDREDEELFIVVDQPIIGIASNDESGEVRFVLKGSLPEAVNTIEGGMLPIGELADELEEDEELEEDSDRKVIDWDAVELALEERNRVLLGSMEDLWGTSEDFDIIQAGMMELAEIAQERNLVIQSGDKNHRHLLYAAK